MSVYRQREKRKSPRPVRRRRTYSTVTWHSIERDRFSPSQSGDVVCFFSLRLRSIVTRNSWTKVFPKKDRRTDATCRLVYQCYKRRPNIPRWIRHLITWRVNTLKVGKCLIGLLNLIVIDFNQNALFLSDCIMMTWQNSKTVNWRLITALSSRPAPPLFHARMPNRAKLSSMSSGRRTAKKKEKEEKKYFLACLMLLFFVFFRSLWTEPFPSFFCVCSTHTQTHMRSCFPSFAVFF